MGDKDLKRKNKKKREAKITELLKRFYFLLGALFFIGSVLYIIYIIFSWMFVPNTSNVPRYH